MNRPLGRELTRTAVTVGSVFALVAAVVISIAATAHAAAAGTGGKSPIAVSLSDVSASKGQLRALLTASSPRDTVNVDPASVRVEVGNAVAVEPFVTPIRHESRSVMLVIDTSGSMGSSGIAAATAAARTFLNQVPSDVQVGLVSFSGKAQVVAPSQSRTGVLSALEALKPGGETALYDALLRAVAAFPKQGSKTLLLLSDGGDTVSKGTLSQAIHQVTATKIRLDAVSFRTKESDNKALGTLSAAGHGRVLEAADQKALTQVFGGAARALAGQVRLSMPVPAGLGGSQPLVVMGAANGHKFTSRTTVVLPAAVAKPKPTPTASAASPQSSSAVPTKQPASSGLFSSPTWAIGSGVLVFLGLLGLGLALAAPVFVPAHKRRIRAMDQIVGTSIQQRAKAATTEGSGTLAKGALNLADRWAKRHASSAKTALLLERADLPLRINEWYVLRCVAAVLGFALCWLWWRGSVVGLLAALVVGSAVGWAAVTMHLHFMASRRARKFESQLPDVLTLVASSLSTGFSLAQAVDAITRDASEPSAKEYSRALAETRIGAEIEDSLDRLAVRMDSTNLRWTVMAIRIQRQVGGNLAETLRTTATTLRDREALKRQVKALSAEGKLSAYILIALPIGLFGYMMMVNKPYVSLLWGSLLGIGMLGFAVVSLVIGTLWMRKVVVVEV